ncbi:MAG TPA: hypothetical protein VNT56_08370 [Acidimicrobiales bacterium]|nr:hypothetical protein [Acidimicrobiales bacterium]
MDLPAPVELSGTWRAAEADEDLRRAFCEADLDDACVAWHNIEVPGHWRSSPGFEDADGPVLYRRRFASAPASGVRAWLVFDGLFYQGDVWLDGEYVGDTEGYFAPHHFDITSALGDRSEHVLGVELACSPERDRTAKHNLTGVFQHWDCLEPDWNPGGIWRPVRLEYTGPVRINALRARCDGADVDQAVVALRAELHSDHPCRIELRTAVGAEEQTSEHRLAQGPNHLDWEISVPDPELWWPHALGDQPLHRLRVEVVHAGATSHTVDRRIGLRSLWWRNGILTVNGERMFLKGANQGPHRMALGEVAGADLAADVAQAREAGLDLVRLHGHISRPEVYEAADELGMLVWQDLPLQWGYARSVRRQALRQAEAAVDLLGHHPCIALWCAHNEALSMERRVEVDHRPLDGPRTALRYAAALALPNWNKSVLDRSLARALRQSDGTRTVLPQSGAISPSGGEGGDAHLYFGWYYGEERAFAGVCRALPRLARFVSEFGAQAVPSGDAAFCRPERWPDLDWDHLARAHNLQKDRFDRYVPPADYPTFDGWRRATQAYQAQVVKHHIETLRRLKYRPAGGFCLFLLADGHPGVTWSVLDHERRPKAGYGALVEACRPVVVLAERLPASVRPGDALALDVHVVSDLRHPIEGAVVEARLSWTGGKRRWRWGGDVAADSCLKVNTLSIVVPEAPGPLDLDLRLVGAPAEATNHYDTEIVAARPGPKIRRRGRE